MVEPFPRTRFVPERAETAPDVRIAVPVPVPMVAVPTVAEVAIKFPLLSIDAKFVPPFTIPKGQCDEADGIETPSSKLLGPKFAAFPIPIVFVVELLKGI
jgi:hypothetical protein